MKITASDFIFFPFAFAFGLWGGVFCFLCKWNFLRINSVSVPLPPHRCVSVHRYLFCVFSYLNVFYFVLSPCPVPHPYLACVSQATQERGVSQPSCCLPEQGHPAPTPQWKQVKELSRGQNGCCFPGPSQPAHPSEPARAEAYTLESWLPRTGSFCTHLSSSFGEQFNRQC